MINNYQNNRKEIDAYRKQLKAMLGDISEIDIKVLSRAVNGGMAVAKRNTPVITGFMRKSWHTTPTAKSKSGVEKSLVNSADYGSYVNDGHRTVNQAGETTGFVKGQFILEKAESAVEKAMIIEFKKEVEKVNKEYGK